jgi:preprotein translocase subunit SecD
MFETIRNRLILIALVVATSLFYLFPRDVTVREQGQDGAMRDTVITRVPLKLGLDLQGGMHLKLELDETNRVSADKSRDLDLARTVLLKRIDEFGVTEPVIQKLGDERIVVELAGITDPGRAEAIVNRTAALEFVITDETNALPAALPAMDRALAQLGISAEPGAAPATASQVQDLITGGRDSGQQASPDSGAAPALDTAGAAAPVAAGGPILQALIQPATSYGFDAVPGEYAVRETAYIRVDTLLRVPEVARLMPRSLKWRWARTPTAVGAEQVRMLYVLENEAIITGERLDNAVAQLDQMTNRPIVTFTLDRAGARRFGSQTAVHIGDFMAIVLDDYVQGRPPVIQGRIDRTGQIEMGGRSIQDAQDLALVLNAGALPIPLKIVERREIGASLGEDSIRGGIIAGIVGTVLIILIMIGYYRIAGALSIVALGLYLLFTLGALSAIDAVLTLPGLAGLVLSIGMAVDANVLIFERIREELIAGKSVRLAVSEGFKHAMSAIIDSNVTMVLTALFLFQFGTGPVQGFAVTLILGVLASMFSAIFVTRTLFMMWLERRDPASTTLSI